MEVGLTPSKAGELEGAKPDHVSIVQPDTRSARVSTQDLMEDVRRTEETKETTLNVCDATDAAFSHLSPQGEPVQTITGAREEGIIEEDGDRANFRVTVHSPDLRGQACGNFKDEFIPIGDLDERGSPDKNDGEDRSTPMGPSGSSGPDSGLRDDNRRLSLKRSRFSCFDNTPSVQVIYKSLTRESKSKLKDLLNQWAQWHGEFVGMDENDLREPLENGDEIYFPPLKVGGTNKSTLSFWMDKASKQARTENEASGPTPSNQGIEKDVPLYDRADTAALISQETEISLDGHFERTEGSRCFNCGSYSHSLKECPRPRDNAAINNARRLYAEKHGSSNASRTASRYYQSSPGGKFDDLKPGILGNETRQLLGIGQRDPPPWLNRMRELGYPPGYLEDQEEEESGITIYGIHEDTEIDHSKDGQEVLGLKKTRTRSVKKMVVHFPGVNAPVPDDADLFMWGSADAKSSRHSQRVSSRNTPSNGTAYSESEDWEGRPGLPLDRYRSSPMTRSPGFETPTSNRSHSWQTSDYSRSGKAHPPPRSPHLGRSASDSGRSSPRFAYDEPHSLLPTGHHSGSRHHSSWLHHSPSAPSLRHTPRSDGREEDLRRRAWGYGQEPLRSHYSHSDRYSPSRRH